MRSGCRRGSGLPPSTRPLPHEPAATGTSVPTTRRGVALTPWCPSRRPRRRSLCRCRISSLAGALGCVSSPGKMAPPPCGNQLAACERWVAAQGSRLSQSASRRKKKGLAEYPTAANLWDPPPTTAKRLVMASCCILRSRRSRDGRIPTTANEQRCATQRAHNRALPPYAETILAGEIARYSQEPGCQGLGARPGHPGPHLSKRTIPLGKCGRWPLARGPPPRETPTHPPMHGQQLAKRYRLPPPPPPP